MIDGRTLRAGTLAASAVLVLAACSASPLSTPGWTYGPSIAPSQSGTPGASAPAAEPTSPQPVPLESVGAAGIESPRPYAGRMSHQLMLRDGHVSMYMLLENNGTAPLTFLNTLYDDEPDQLWTPTVAFPWTDGEVALTTRAGRFFPSPTVVGPGRAAIYMMGGQPVTGSGELDRPVANIKFCPTRGMDQGDPVPAAVSDVAWSVRDGVTTVTGTLTEAAGFSRPSLPIVGVAFFDAADRFVGAVVANRVGEPLAAGESRPFEISGLGVETDRIDHAQAYAFVP
jgi:hypothetical protein